MTRQVTLEHKVVGKSKWDMRDGWGLHTHGNYESWIIYITQKCEGR